MGVVFRATQLALDRPVALKAIVPELAPDSDYRDRFQRESRLAASIDHPNVIPVYEAGDVDGTLYLIMRWVEGPDLRSLLKTSGRFSPRRAIRLLQPVAAALAAAHRRGLIHRDVKPANVLIRRGDDEREGHVYLTDFGIARRIDAESTTHTGVFLGTIDYAAPERFQGGMGEPRSDIYSLGCVLFEALTGHVPFERLSAVAKIFAHVDARVPSARAEVEAVPEGLDAIIAKAMAKNPEDRFGSAGELVGALAETLERLEAAEERPAAPGPVGGVPRVDSIAPTMRARSGPASSPRLVGREQEISTMRAGLDDAVRGVPSVMLLVGEAGVGKTRLLRELEAIAHHDGMLVMHGECLELSVGELPYAPIAAALRNADRAVITTALSDLPRDARRQLARVFPDSVREEAADSVPDDVFGQARLFGSILLLLRQLSEHAPLMLSIEDLHRADMSSRDFLRFLVHSLNSERFVTIASVLSDELYRGHPVRQLVTELVQQGEPVTRIDLAPLSRQAVEKQVAGILGTVPPEALVRDVFTRGEGNPFYTEVLVAAGTTGTGEVPPTIRDVLLLRADRLGEHPRRILRLIAAAGRPIDDAFVELAAELPREDVEMGLRQCVNHNLVVSDRRTGSYSIRHALVSEAVYSDLLPAERTAVHSMIATALEHDARAENAAERARHWDLAHQPAKALLGSIEAGLAAERVFGYGEALSHFERAIELWSRHPPAPYASPLGLVDLLTRAAEAARSIGDSDRAYALCRRALDEVDQSLDPVRAAQLYERLGQYQPWDPQGSLAAYRQARDLLPEDRATERSRLYVDEACAYSYLGQWEEARERATRALDLDGDDRRLVVESSARAVLGVAIAFLGDPPAGEQELRRALALAREANSIEHLAQIHLDLGEVLRLEARVEEALGLMLEGERVALAGGHHRAAGFLAVNAADDLLRVGRWDELEERLPALAHRRLDQPAQLMLHGLAARLDSARGRFDAAVVHFDAAVSLCDSLDLLEFVPKVYSGYAELELWQDCPAAAQAHIADGLQRLGAGDNLLYIPLLHSMGARAAADVSIRARAEGNSADAKRAEQAALEHHQSLETVVVTRGIRETPPEATGHLAICAAEVTRATGTPVPARWFEAANCWRNLTNPYQLAYLVYRYAEALQSADDKHSSAEGAFQEAHALCVPLAARPLLAAIQSRREGHVVAPIT
jgi:tetratricopeptide (TPR) repeat protein